MEIKWNHLREKKLNPKEERKKQMGQRENKQQDGQFKSDDVDNYIKYKWFKHLSGRDCQTG